MFSFFAKRRRVSQALAVAALLTACAAQAQQPAQDFSAGPPTGAYSFPSTTPASLPDLIRPKPGVEAANIVGHFFLPAAAGAAGSGKKAPAIVLIHGSGGIYRAML